MSLRELQLLWYIRRGQINRNQVEAEAEGLRPAPSTLKGPRISSTIQVLDMHTNTTPDVSLTSRAMLCALSIGQWSARKHDREASEEIAARHGAKSDVGRYNKVLIPREALAKVQKIAGEARRKHYFMTLPWDDAGYRVLPAAAYMDHTDRLRTYAAEFGRAADAFAASSSSS